MTTVEGQPYSQPTTSPTTKVVAGGSAGAITVVLLFTLAQFDIVVPAEVGSALTVILSFVASYFVKERSAWAAQVNPQRES